MKTRFVSLAVLATVATALFSCSKEAELETPNDNNTNKETVEVNEGTPFELIAGALDTKTTNDGVSTKWESTDKINVFYAEASQTSYTNAGQFTSTGTGSSVAFTGTVGELNDYNDWFAFYPYKSSITTPNNTSTYYITCGGGQTWGSSATATAHLCGEKFPVCGRAMNVAKATKPTIEMYPAMSVVKVHVTNNSGAALTVNSVTFTTADYAINGSFYIAFNGAAPVFTEKSGSVGKSSTLTVQGGRTIAALGTEDFYIGVVPFTAASGKKLTVTVNGYSKELTLSSEAVFAPGKVKTLNFNYNEIASVATLPFSIDGSGGSSAYSSTDGLSASGLGTDYSSVTHGVYITKFDTDGDYFQVYFNEAAAKATIGVKMIGGSSASSFDVKGSADGVTFTQIENLAISGAQNSIQTLETIQDIDPSYRYLRFVFNKGSNVGVGPVSITKPSTTPAIIASNVTGISVTGTATTLSYTIKNFSGSDDVEVSGFDGVVESASVTSSGTVTYTVSPNYGTGTANGSITLHSDAEGIDKVITISQDGETFATTATATITLGKDAMSTSFTITTASFAWASTVTPGDGKNLTIDPTSGYENASAQTITINTTTAATASEQTLGTIVLYRNGNASDTQKKTITIKKAAYAAGVSWVETALADLTTSDEFVIVGNGCSMSNGNGTTNPPTAAAVTVMDGKITSAVTDAITWTLVGNSTSGYTFYPKGSTTTWLYCNTSSETGSNNNMRVGTGARKVFVLETYSAKNYLVTKDDKVKRYVCVYNSSDWRGYVQSSVVATDTKFYKKVTE